MELNRIVFFNATLDDNIHEMIDSSLIVAFAQKTPVDVFFLERRSSIVENLIKNTFSLSNIKFHPLYNIKQSGAIKDLIAAVLELYLLLFKGDRKSLYVCSYANMFSRYLLNIGSKMTGKKVLICAHSELETVVTCKLKGAGYWAQLMGFFYRLKLAPRLRIMVLGDSILDELRKHVSEENFKKFISIIHPYFHSINPKCKSLSSDVVHIGVVGVVSRSAQRGFDNLMSFALKINKKCNVRIHIISRIDKELQRQLPQSVIIENPAERYLPKEEYEFLIQQMDYLYFPYPKDAFKLTASGAIFESIAGLRPPLMHSNHFFIYLAREYGDFGMFVDQLSDDEFLKTITDKDKYEKMCGVLTDFSKKIYPLNLSDILYEKIDEAYVY